MEVNRRLPTAARASRPDYAEVAAAKEKRVSRACIACRQRKTRCELALLARARLSDSDGIAGVPPCRRCIQECRECVLASSRRGGRRPKERLRSIRPTDGISGHPSRVDADAAVLGQTHGDGDGDGDEIRPSQEPPASTRTGLASSVDTANNSRCQSTRIESDVDGHIISTDLLNPSDALDLLAHVADLGRDEYREQNALSDQAVGHISLDQDQPQDASNVPTSFEYPPISNGLLSCSDASRLLSHYHKNFHPFFPVADKHVFDGSGILRLIESEPHLLTAILTVASKDDLAWSITHQACSSHMESLISKLIHQGSTTVGVGAIEALLILAEWAPQRLQEKPTIGSGEEDHGAWMEIGVAIRLAYLQGLEQTGLYQDKKHTKSDFFNRKRLAWAACYMSDREVSIRLGKGFWSRGPGPTIVMRAADFPSLQAQEAGSGDLALLFQAHLEMTQLFSNAHDILYASTSHRGQLCAGGEYVRYIDDFATVLRNWKLVWGGLSFTPLVKAALILSYEFLRLYIHAFAFQASINRAIARARETSPSSRQSVRPLFADLAGTPDARFIYESVDAAMSLLTTLNDFIDPASGLRFMPLKYYLYVIYAAVFLFKARLSGALASDASSSVRRTINLTIDRLQKSSLSPHSLGHRYARSLYLLWRKPAERAAANRHNAATATARQGQKAVVADTNVSPGGGTQAPAVDGTQITGLEPFREFSWRDLDSLGQFIGNNSNFDFPITTPMSESDHSAMGQDVLTDAWYDLLLSGNEVIF